jgi:hypothetical protein
MTGNITLGTNTIDGLEINTTDTSNLGLGTGAVDSITTGDYNVGVGLDALTAVTEGSGNTAVGALGLYNNTTGAHNTTFGYHSLRSTTTGHHNTAIGSTALLNNTTGQYNIAAGFRSLYSNTTGSNNVATGYEALYANTTGTNNTASGSQALYSNTTGAYNTAIGRTALYFKTTGSYNTALGYAAGDNITTGSSNIIIGAGVDAPSATASNQLNIGNWIKGVDGNIGIGVTPEAWHSNYTALQFAGNGALSGWGNQQAGAAVFLSQNASADQTNDWEYISTDEASRYEQVNGAHTFSVAASGTADAAITWTTAMTIENSGRVLLTAGGAAVRNNGVLQLNMGATSPLSTGMTINAYDIGNWAVDFRNPSGANVGEIVINASSTSYSTSSDYRLKENVVPMVGSIDRLKALKPSKFNFIADPLTTVDGFLAHEAQEVVPEAVHGTKDAMKDEEYEVTPAVMDGDTVVTEAVMGTRSVPDYQGIDQSKLVPLLVASLQEAVAKIEALEARVTALEV